MSVAIPEAARCGVSYTVPRRCAAASEQKRADPRVPGWSRPRREAGRADCLGVFEPGNQHRVAAGIGHPSCVLAQCPSMGRYVKPRYGPGMLHLTSPPRVVGAAGGFPEQSQNEPARFSSDRATGSAHVYEQCLAGLAEHPRTARILDSTLLMGSSIMTMRSVLLLDCCFIVEVSCFTLWMRVSSNCLLIGLESAADLRYVRSDGARQTQRVR